MRSANLSCKTSAALMKENFRQFWPLPVIAFLYYFATGILPLIISYNRLEVVINYAQQYLGNATVFLFIGNALIPICAAISVLKFLHIPSASTAAHSLPFSRAKLFNSAVLSGWIMTVVPIGVTGILFSLMAGASPSADAAKNYGTEYIAQMGTISPTDGLVWILFTVITVTFVYAISILAGVITGTPVMNALVAVFLNLIPLLMLWLTQLYLEMYLNGYTENEILYKYVSPLTYPLAADTEGSADSYRVFTVFLIAALVLIFISALLYQKAKVERVGESTLFHFAGDLLTYLLAFISMTAFAFIMTAIVDEDHASVLFYVGAVTGALIGLVIARMIVERTPRVFDKATLKRVIIYGIIAAAFFCLTAFDFTGYEKRIPEADNVASVYLDINDYTSQTGIVSVYSNGSSMRLKTPEAIALVQDLHQAEIKTNDNNSKSGSTVAQITIKYALKSGGTISRTYEINDSEKYAAALREYAKLYTNKEFIARYYGDTIFNPSVIKATAINYANSESIDIKGKRLQDLQKAMMSDARSRTYNIKDIWSNDKSVTTDKYAIDKSIDPNEYQVEIDMYDAKENTQLSVNVLVGDDNTVKLLESYGLTVSK